MSRIICFDYGRARIGVAYSDPRKILATAFEAIPCKKKREATYEEIKKKISHLAPFELILVGLPLLLSGAEGEMALEAKKFGEGLAKFLSVPCVFWDERLSSSQADRILREGDLNRKKRALFSDTMAATLILRNYLDFQAIAEKKLS